MRFVRATEGVALPEASNAAAVQPGDSDAVASNFDECEQADETILEDPNDDVFGLGFEP